MSRIHDGADSGIPQKVRRVEGVQLDINPTSKYSGAFPFFRQPREIGIFCQDSERKFRHDKHQLRYLILPKNINEVRYDLGEGFGVAILRDDTVKEYLDDLLRWVVLNGQQFVPAASATASSRTSTGTTDAGLMTSVHKTGQRLFTDFICWRGLLTKLLCTPYENREGWQISVSLYRGTLYMCEFETDEKRQQKAKQTSREKEMTYWGYKFEQYLTSDAPSGTPDTSQPVNNNEGFGSVVRTRLNKHSLVYGGEVDCCEQDGTDVKYVELKTNRELYKMNNERNFKRFKLLKWWAQSFLLGIPKIIGGFRDDEGIVRRLEVFKTLEIPKMLRDIRDPWNPNVCFNFLDSFLQFVKDTVKIDDPSVTYVFRWNPSQLITVEEYPAKSDFTFLPKWYTDRSQDHAT